MANREPVYIVSACLLGVKCRYDGKAKTSRPVLKFLTGKSFVPVCPETLAGLPIPRPSASFSKGSGKSVIQGTAKIIDTDGQDIAARILRGAEEMLRIAKLVRASHAILKDKSPSCGVHKVYVGKRLVNGMGVAAAMLMENGVKVVSEDECIA